jgi:hypothetical protein
MAHFQSVANVNVLIWITSLNSNHEGSTRRVLDDLEPFFARIGLPFEKFDPKSAAEFLAILDALVLKASEGWKPVVHIDTHGAQDAGIAIAASGEFVSWAAICERFRAINTAAENNLCVVSAACFSLHMIGQIEIAKASPFYLLIAPEDEVSFGFIEDNITQFYKAVFTNLSIVTSYEKNLVQRLTLFHSERLFIKAIVGYFHKYCVGERAKSRRENLMSMALDDGIPNTPQNIRMMRSTAKAMIKPRPELVESYGRTFLCGKQIPLSFSKIIKIVQRQIDEEERENARKRKALKRLARKH